MKKLKKLLSAINVFFLVTALAVPPNHNIISAAGTSPLKIFDLKTENLKNPLAVPVSAPRFSWKLSSAKRSQGQSAYQIILYNQNGTVIWNTGKVRSTETVGIEYSGTALEYSSRYTWKVKVWDKGNLASDWSETAYFETELSESDWGNAEWIRRRASGELDLSGAYWIWSKRLVDAETVYFRGSVTANSAKTLQLAAIAFAVDDYATVYLNGEKLSDSTSGWGTAKSIDITSLIKKGKNLFAVKADNTSSGLGGFIAKIILRYTDGTEETFVTDDKWIFSKTPSEGWEKSEYDASAWSTPKQTILYGEDAWGSAVKVPEIYTAVDPAPYLRKEFTANDKQIKSARAYITGLGHYELFLNGQRVGDNVIDPLVTVYANRCFYVTYDVTDMLNSGTNAIGVVLGRGYYATADSTINGSALGSWQTKFWAQNPGDYPLLRMKLLIEYTDGTFSETVSDKTWKTYNSPTVLDEPYYGETYNARLEIPNWNSAGFDDTKWDNAIITNSPSKRVEPQTANANKIVETLAPVSLTKASDTTYIFDMGRIITGWVQINVNGNSGDEVVIKYAEKLNSDGSISRDNFMTDWNINGLIRQAQTDYYTLKGGGEEIWEPRFTYKGFRYVEITTTSEALELNDVIGKVVNADVESIGTFSCSNELFNQIHTVARNSILINLHSYPSDTPIYENLGYLGDGYVIQETGMYNFDLTSFYEKWAEDIREASWYRWTDVAPGGGSGKTSPEWSGAICFVPWQSYLLTGDTYLLEKNYSEMKSVFTDIKKEMTDNIIASRWGDHIAQRSNIPYISGTSHIYYMADIISKSAKILGYTSDAALYRSEAELLKSSFNDTFYNAELGYYCEPDSTEFYQSAQILPLAFGIVPDEYTETLCKNLENLITKYESGIYGTKHIFNQLCQLGLGNLAYSLVNTTDYPGWGNIISQGATAFWERWETSTRSQSHHMFGTVDEWFYKSIAGISYDEVGFSSITIKPYTVGDLTWASGSVNTVKGLISSRWQIHENNVFTLQLSVPANTTATVYIPAEDISEVTESGMSATASEGVKFLKTENGYAVYSVGSGNYNFQSGNVSDDGITDIRDFIRLKRYLANPETPIGTYADYNGDGKIDANDLTSLKKKLLNQ